MINLKLIFENFSILKEKLKNRGIKEEDLLLLKKKIEKKKQLWQHLNKLREKRNIQSKTKETTNDETKKEQTKNIRKEIQQKQKKVQKLEEEINELANQIPNIPHHDVPEEKNKEIKITNFFHFFSHSFTQETIIKKLQLTDENKAKKLSGNKFIVYQKFGTLLLHALINFLLHENKKEGYELFDTPYLVKKENLYNTGQLPKFKQDLYQTEKYILIPTAEVTLVNMYQKTTFFVENLPLKICGYSPCFRLEAGAPGQENKGIIRLHQFHKVELVQIVHPKKSYQALEEMVNAAKKILQKLQISHRIVEIASPELGFSASKTFDIEVWLPISKKWLEISSCSNCEDFQARRAKINFLENKKKLLVHTLNASSLAIDRLIATLCEYYYQPEENQLKLPECLKRFLII